MPDAITYTAPIIARRNTESTSQQRKAHPRLPPYPIQNEDLVTCVGSSVRQPTAEDFLRHDHQLLELLADEEDFDQRMPVIEPGTYMDDEELSIIEPDSYDGEHDVYSERLIAPRPLPEQSSFTLITSTHEKATATESENLPHMRMATDIFSPVLGGLHNITALRRKVSKRDRGKGFLKRMSFRHRR